MKRALLTWNVSLAVDENVTNWIFDCQQLVFEIPKCISSRRIRYLDAQSAIARS
jgi:hypothetical protein